MKGFLSLLILIAVALAGAVLWQWLAADPGYLQLVWLGWSIETTLPVAIAITLLALIVLLALIWLARRPLHGWRRRQLHRARQQLADGLVAMHRGQWSLAEKQFSKVARDPRLQVAAALQGLRAAHEREDARAAADWMAMAREQGGESDTRLIEAEQRLADGLPETALERFDVEPERRPTGPRALEVRLRALQAAGRAEQALAEFSDLRRSGYRSAESLTRLESELAASSLQQADSGDALLQRWQSLSRGQRRRPPVTSAFVQQARQLGEDARAAKAMETALKREWDAGLAAQYGRLEHCSPRERIRQLEAWLDPHPDSPEIQLALGRLCCNEQLWGKAEDYLDRTLKAAPGSPLAQSAWECLGDLHADRDDLSRARLCYLNALRLGRGETAKPLPERKRIRQETSREPSEQRDANGVPRLERSPEKS